jgi:hypothetical protein
MLAPISIIRTIAIMETKNNKELVSTTFIAKFEDKSEKFLNKKEWQPIGLLRSFDLENKLLDETECTLYWKDWSKNPMFGTFENNYPPSLFPKEILDLLPLMV